MADSARIEDLRKRYHEHPRRFFAPLANEYRKAGLLDRAILLCEKHLAEQPENMNGLVVYGQTLFEFGRQAEARVPFERALALDPENLIALRHLGDIARLGGDLTAAKGWYEKVLEFDRRNDEVLDLLEQMGMGPEKEPPPSPRPSTLGAGLVSVAPTVSVSGGGASDVGLIDLAPPAAAPAAPAGPGKTKIVNAQRLADQDRAEAEAAGGETLRLAASPVASAGKAVEVTPPARPNKRASLLDVNFDFSEIGESAATPPPTPAKPVLGAEAAEYGFAAETAAPSAGNFGIEPSAAPAPQFADAAHDDALLIEPTAAAEPLLSSDADAADEMADFELADYSGTSQPLAGLEPQEFHAEDVAPLADVEISEPTTMPSARTVEGLDRPDVHVDHVDRLAGLEGAMETEPTAQHTAGLPLLGATPTEPQRSVDDVPSLANTLPMAPFEPPEPPTVPSPRADFPTEPPSATPIGGHRPRMTKADLASLPLLADFGLEDDAPSAPRVPQKTPTFVTETMATLYLQQGFRDKAIDVYRQLVAQAPTDAGLRARLADLEAPASAPVARDEMPEFDAPVGGDEPAPAPANAMLSGMSFAGVGLATPAPAVAALAMPPATGPTAREFFAAFARRGLAAATAAAVAAATPSRVSLTPTGWPLDALFGAPTEVRDMHAAEVLAGVSTFAGPSGGSGLDALFGAGSAAPNAAPEAPTSGARRTVNRASQMLKFDQFFSPQQAQASVAAPPAPPAVPDAPATPAAAPPDAGAPDDDLGQFQDWLKGLKT